MKLYPEMTVNLQVEESIYRYYDPNKKEEGTGKELPQDAVIISLLEKKRYKESYRISKDIIREYGTLIKKEEIANV